MLTTSDLVVEVYCPSMLRYPNFRLEMRDSTFLDENLPSMMQDPLITASSLALASRLHDKSTSRKMLWYYGKAVYLLHQRLACGDPVLTKTILLTLIHLMAVEVQFPAQGQRLETDYSQALCEKLGSPLRHFAIMRHLVQSRPSTDSSSLSGYINAHFNS